MSTAIIKNHPDVKGYYSWSPPFPPKQFYIEKVETLLSLKMFQIKYKGLAINFLLESFSFLI